MAIEEDISDFRIASTRKMATYGFGFVVVQVLVNVTGWFYYYEVEVGLPVLYLMIAYIIFAIWNMVNDPLVGYLTDRPFKWTKKYGLRAPWIYITAFPMLICLVLIRTPPFGAPVLTIFLYFIITTCVFDTFVSIYSCHVNGGFTNHFPSEYERRRAFTIATFLMRGIILFTSIITLSIIQWGRPETFILATTITAIILGCCNIVLFFAVRESEEMKQMFIKAFEKAEKKSYFETVKISLKTRNFTVSLLGYTLWATAVIGLWNSSTLYMYKDVYGIDPSAAIIPVVVGIGAGFLFIPFWSNYSRKHGFKKTYWITFLLAGLSFIPFLFTRNIIEHTIGVVFQSFALAGTGIVLMPVASDTFDEVASHLEKRAEATLQGMRNFFFRVSFIIQAVVLYVVHVLTNYNPNPGATQTPLAILGIRIHAALIPAILFITMALIFKKYYTLEGAEKEALVRKLRELNIYR